MIGSPNKIEIDLSALAHNFAQVKRLVAPKTKIMGIVKSDAYGHGLLRISRFLEKAGVDCLGVAYLHEALELRKNGVRVSIVVLSGIGAREEACAAIEYGLTPVLSGLDSASLLSEECARMRGKEVRVQLKIDTGMGRLGIPHQETAAFLTRLRDHKGLFLEALTSHLSSADDLSSDFTQRQVDHFRVAVKTGREMGFNTNLNNLANSAGIMAHEASHFDMVRPGIMLYGASPSPGFKKAVPLAPVMSFKARILQVRDLPDRTPVSYRRTYYTRGFRRIAVLSAGYGDGLSRRLSNRGKVLIGGRPADIVGRVCMNMTMADVTGIPNAEVGREVVFLGEGQGERITGEDMALWGETVPYEVFCAIGRANRKDYTS